MYRDALKAATRVIDGILASLSLRKFAPSRAATSIPYGGHQRLTRLV